MALLASIVPFHHLDGSGSAVITDRCDMLTVMGLTRAVVFLDQPKADFSSSGGFAGKLI